MASAGAVSSAGTVSLFSTGIWEQASQMFGLSAATLAEWQKGSPQQIQIREITCFEL
jgi:hypothetical protein